MRVKASKYGPVAGRVLLALIFVMTGYSKIGGFAQTAGDIASKGLPMPSVLLVLTIAIELGAGFDIDAGDQAVIPAKAGTGICT